MNEQKFSDFTLNFNPGARGNHKAPTLRGNTSSNTTSRERLLDRGVTNLPPISCGFGAHPGRACV